MDIKEKKLAVLHQLNGEVEPISLHDLLQKLGDQYAERSVRRWLGEGIKQGLVEKLGRKRGTKYQAIQLLWGEKCFGHISSKVIEQVRRPLYERKPTAYNDEWFDAYEPNVSFYFPSAIRSRLRHVGKRSHHEDPAGTYAHKIFDRLLIDLSYNSSRLEGNTYSLYEDPKRLQLQLDRIVEKAALIKDPYEQSLFLLVHITYLQAFSDVNKRTARLSANIPLVTHNLVPLSFNDVEKDDYI